MPPHGAEKIACTACTAAFLGGQAVEPKETACQHLSVLHTSNLNACCKRDGVIFQFLNIPGVWHGNISEGVTEIRSWRALFLK